jgi:hypothetical protein
MLHFIDQTSEDKHHMVFNASMISILMSLYPDAMLTAHGIASNHAAIYELLNEAERKRIIFSTIEYTKPAKAGIAYKALNYIKKERARMRQLDSIVAGAADDDFIFFSVSTFYCFYYLKKIKTKHPVNVLATLHGGIDYFYNPQNYMEKINAWYHKRMFKLKAPNFKYLLLNKIAKSILIKDGYLKANEVMEIEHPYPNVGKTDSFISLTKEPLVVAHLGSTEAQRKNSHYLYQLAAKSVDNIRNGSLRFKIIGLKNASVKPWENEWVEEVVGKKTNYLDRPTYEHEVKAIHYSVFFFPTNEYICRASGAVVDTLIFEKPIFTLYHPYFEYLFRVAGNVGYMVETLDEMKSIIEQIVLNPEHYKEEYQLQCDNLKKFKNQLTIESVRDDLKKQMDELSN